MDIIRTRQKNWLGQILGGDSLRREIMKGRLEGKRKAWTKIHGLDCGDAYCRPVFFSPITDDNGTDDGGRIRETGGKQREEWSRWTFGPAGRQMT